MRLWRWRSASDTSMQALRSPARRATHACAPSWQRSLRLAKYQSYSMAVTQLMPWHVANLRNAMRKV
eukprot:1468965-Alexandrium_andersonii.AAC.1